MTASEDLAKFATGFDFVQLPSDVVQFTKNMILDLVGNVLGGYTEPDPKRVINAIKSYDIGAGATIWGDGSMTSTGLAAFANTSSAEGNDYTFGWTGVIPSAFAVGEKTKADGKTVIAGIVAGFEVLKRVGQAMHDPTMHKRGFYWPELPLGATVAAGKVLNLTAEQMTWALGLAGSSGTAAWFPFDEGLRTKLFFHGKAALVGIISCYFAMQGFEGPRKLFEIEDKQKHPTFLKMYSDPNYDYSKLTEKLGEFILKDVVLYKLYPSCRASHSSIDAAYELVKKYSLSPEDIEKVVIHVSDRDVQLVGRPEQLTKVDAQFSIQYLVAATITEKSVPTLQFFTDEKLKNRRIIELAKRVEVVGDPELTKIRTYPSPPFIHPARLQAHTKDGKSYIVSVDYFKGTPQNPPSADELRVKFDDQAKRALTTKKVGQVFSMIQTLEKLKDVGELSRAIRP